MPNNLSPSQGSYSWTILAGTLAESKYKIKARFGSAPTTDWSDNVILGSNIYTDGHKGYRQLNRCGYYHDWVDHESGEYIRGDVHTQTLDGYWGLLKNRLAAIGGIRRRRLRYFIGEHQWRYNFRHLTRKEQVIRIYKLLIKFGGRS